MWPMRIFHKMRIISMKYRYIHEMRILSTEHRYFHKMGIISKKWGYYPWSVDIIHAPWILSTECEYFHKIWITPMTRSRYCNLSHNFIAHLYSLHGTQHCQTSTPWPRLVIPNMSTPNMRVAEMIARSSGSSGGRHGDPARARNYDMIARASGNRSSRHGYLINKVSSSHGNPRNSVRASVKLKTVYVGKTDTLSTSFS